MAPADTLSFKKALVTGGAGGLGKAMAADLVRRGKQVLLVGRTESSLAKTAKEIGAAGHYVLDVGDIAGVDAFIDRVIAEHPDLDCVINNAGVQRPFQILGPTYDFDLAKADEEIDIDIRAPLHLCVGLTQKHFQHLHGGAVIMNVSSVLGFVPFSVINPNYNASKSWLHFFTVNLRTQLAQAGSKIKVVEIVPPQVETDLHRDRENPNDNKRSHGATSAMTVDEYMADVGNGWEGNDDIIAPGPAAGHVDVWQEAIGSKYEKMVK